MFYFSPANLAKDKFLRDQLDSQGFAKIAVIAKFARVRALEPNAGRLLQAMRDCPGLEVDETSTRVRGAVNANPKTEDDDDEPKGGEEEERDRKGEDKKAFVRRDHHWMSIEVWD
jgi:hypothetical protein